MNMDYKTPLKKLVRYFKNSRDKWKHRALEKQKRIDDRSTGEIICRYLDDLAGETGVPAQIISDHGSDLKKGADLFVRKHACTCYTYDITHEIGLLLKKLLEKDPKWKAFLTWCGTIRRKVLQTELGFPAPPDQRAKARYLNFAPLIGWGCNLLQYQEKSDFTQICSNYSLDCQTLVDVISEQRTADELQALSGETYILNTRRVHCGC